MDLNVKIEKASEAMGGWEFVASVVASTAWPIAVVAFALIFRSQITGLLNNVRRLTWGDKSVDLATRLDDAENNSKDLVGQRHPSTPEIAEPENVAAPSPEPTGGRSEAKLTARDRFYRLLEISPAAAVIDSWSTLSSVLERAGARQEYDDATIRQLNHLVRRLRDDGLLPEAAVPLIFDLRRIRNIASHSPAEVTDADAMRFMELIDRLVAEVDEAYETAKAEAAAALKAADENLLASKTSAQGDD